jgi:hypothetical protein
MLPMPCTLTRPDIVGWRMRGFVPVVASVFVRLAVMRLMDIRPVRFVVLRRTYVVSRFGPVRLVVVPMLRRTLVVVPMLRRSLMVVIVTVVAGFVSLVMVGATVMVVIVPVLCVRRSTCCESKS